MENSTATERQAEETQEKEESLAEILAKHMDEPAQEETAEAETSPTDETPAEEPQTTEESSEPETTEEAAPQEDKAASAIDAPQHWTQTERDAFGKLPDDLKQFYLEKQKSIQSDATKKWEEAASLRKKYEPLDQVLEPYEKEFARRGVDRSAAVNNLLAVWNDLESNPQKTIKWLAEQYGVALDDLEQAYVEPEITSLKQELSELKQGLKQKEESSATEQRMSWVEEFTSLKDDKGNLLYPRFFELFEDITPFVHPTKTREEALAVLKNAYEKAQWANPNSRSQLLEAEAKAKAKVENEKRIAEAKAKAEKARKAGHSLSSGQGSSTYKEPSNLGLRELLEKNMGA